MSIIASKGNSANVTFTNPQEIVISHADDSIKVGDGTDLLVINSDGSINSTSVNASTADVTSVNVTTSSTQLLAANVNRKAVIIFNDSGANIYVKYGTGATTTSFTWRVANNGVLEIYNNIYNGVIHAVRASGTGDVRVTEVY